MEGFERRQAPYVPRPFGRRPGDNVQLTARQRQVLELVAEGLENKEIAGMLGISEQGVKQQVSVLLRKFEAPSRASLTRNAVTMRLLGTSGHPMDLPLEYLFDRAPLMIAMSEGADHRFVLVNRAFVEAFGDRRYVGRSFSECFPGMRGRILEVLSSVYERGVAYRAAEQDLRIVMPDGSVKEIHTSFIVEPRRARDGAVDGLVFYGSDITQQVVLRTQLQQLTTAQRVLLEQLPVGVIYTDARARAVLVNPVAQRIIGPGFDPARPIYEQLIGWNVRYASTGELLTPENAPSARAIAGWPFDDDVLLATPDGPARRIHISARPLHDDGGNVTGAMLVLTERTEGGVSSDGPPAAAPGPA